MRNEHGYGSSLRRWQRKYNWPKPEPYYPPTGYWSPSPMLSMPTQEEIDEFRRLLEKAKEYDKEHNEPDGEVEEKRRRLKELAEQLGIDISFV